MAAADGGLDDRGRAVFIVQANVISGEGGSGNYQRAAVVENAPEGIGGDDAVGDREIAGIAKGGPVGRSAGSRDGQAGDARHAARR